MYYVYVLVNPEKRLYVGFTTDLERRLWQHNNTGSRWTHARGPWELLYKEEYQEKREAIKREKFFKSGKGREYLKNILNGV